MPILKLDPFDDLRSLIESIFDVPSFRAGWDLAVDVFKDGNNLIAELTAPGIDPEKIDIHIEKDLLRVSGSREEKKEHKGKDFYSKEIRRGHFERTIRLPTEVVSEKTKATYKDGVLRVTMPIKHVEEKPKKVKIEVEK